ATPRGSFFNGPAPTQIYALSLHDALPIYTAITTGGVYKVPQCVQDVVSSMYYARNINFNKYNPGDRIPFTLFLDNEVYNMYIRRSEEHTSELQSLAYLVCRLLLEKKKSTW